MRTTHALLLACGLLAAQPAPSCELLIKATEAAHPDPIKDARGRAKRGMVIEVREDGAVWSSAPLMPRFALIKVPGIPAERAQKFLEPETDSETNVVRYRRWKVRWDDLPLAARQKLAQKGELIIKAGTYQGEYDYTWLQVRNYFRDLKTGTDGGGDL